MIFGLRVVSLDGTTPTRGQFLTRNLLRVVDAGLAFLPVLLVPFSPLRSAPATPPPARWSSPARPAPSRPASPTAPKRPPAATAAVAPGEPPTEPDEPADEPDG